MKPEEAIHPLVKAILEYEGEVDGLYKARGVWKNAKRPMLTDEARHILARTSVDTEWEASKKFLYQGKEDILKQHPEQEEIWKRCRRGYQQCSKCFDNFCGDNTNPNVKKG